MRNRNCGERWSVLWGKGGRGRAAIAIVILGVAATLAGGAGEAAATAPTAFVPTELQRQAEASPDAPRRVVLERRAGAGPRALDDALAAAQAAAPGTARGLVRRLAILDGASAVVTGRQLRALAANPAVAAITPDAPVAPADYSNGQMWPSANQASAVWTDEAAGLQTPAIAVVDSGVDTTHAGLAGRVLAEVSLYTGANGNSAGDGRGHGTFVAGIAAGVETGHAGVSPGSKIVSLDVLDDGGSGYASDLIAACDWILAHKTEYGIRVANFSLTTSQNSSVLYDPLDKAVERLWLGGVVVVAAAGNYGSGTGPSGVLYAPGNDPFVITVGADDIEGSAGTNDDVAAPWSAYGYTNDGFFKPELAAPGRVMNGPVPSASTMVKEHPERLVAPGYMWMSGTSFAAPVVAADAAYVLAKHPDWTPDQVKGALMVRANVPAGYASNGALGVGITRAAGAASVTAPPSPNAGLNEYVVTDATGQKQFDATAWSAAAQANLSWNSLSWNSLSWSSAAWNSLSWNSLSWNSMAWVSLSWNSTTQAALSWNSLSWASSSWVE